jgi:hypothetical protein
MALVLEKIAVENKKCRRCGGSFLHDYFYRDKNRKDGRHPWCKICISDKNKTYRETVKTQQKCVPNEKFCLACSTTKSAKNFAEAHTNLDGLYTYCNDCKNNRAKATRYRRAYGFSIEQAKNLAMNDVQNCEICGILGKVVVDHCHQTSVVRGFLCNSCNMVLGFAKDSTDTLQKAIQYLERAKL